MFEELELIKGLNMSQQFVCFADSSCYFSVHDVFIIPNNECVTLTAMCVQYIHQVLSCQFCKRYYITLTFNPLQHKVCLYSLIQIKNHMK